MDNKINLIINVLDQMYPDAYCELNHRNDFELLIAVLLSAQTTDKAVNKLTHNLFEKYHNPQDYLNVNIKELENDIKSIGLYRNKAKNIKLLSQQLIDNYQGIVPSERVDLESLAGVGRKTANVVLANAFNIPAFAVDTHVERVAKRLKLAYQNDSVLVVEKKLMKKFSKDLWSKLHHQFIFFGRYHCKAINPNCQNCLLKEICRYPSR
ncbi:MAG: endonuclease III [Bacilli bacterium]|jgi:endonuclease-3|nr:endonuclease III [Bacilli bacterium]